MPGQARKCTDLSLAEEKIALFKAVWEPFEENIFTCGDSCHVLCEPLSICLCDCEDRPRFKPEQAELRSFEEYLFVIVQPALAHNQQYLDLLHHTALHHQAQSPSETITVTFADVAASAGNLRLLQHLFTSSNQCVRQFHLDYYTYGDTAFLLNLFLHALNSGSRDVVLYLTDKFMEEFTSGMKISILEVCLWVGMTDNRQEQMFQELVLKFGVNLASYMHNYTPLFLTCFFENGSLAEFLIDHGANMYAAMSSGSTVASQAYIHGGLLGRHCVLRTLLHKGLRIDAFLEAHTTGYRFPLMYSFIQYNELDLVRLLVDYGHGVNLRIRFRADNQDHRITPLMLALVCRHMDIVRWLIENGADCNARSFVSQQLDDESWTPLHMAATIGKLPIVRTLVEHGAHLDALTDSGETVLCMASPKEVDMDTKAYLLQINAPLWSVPGSSVMVKCRDRRAAAHQWSLLELAVYNGDLLFAEALLQSRHYQDRPALSDFVCHETSLHDREQIAVMQYVQEFISTLQAPSLQRMCRDVLRAYCGTHLRQYVRTVVMPARLRSMLLLEDVLGPLKTSENKEKDDNDS